MKIKCVRWGHQAHDFWETDHDSSTERDERKELELEGADSLSGGIQTGRVTTQPLKEITFF